MLLLLVVGWVGAALLLMVQADRLVDPAGPLIPAVLAANGAALVLFARSRTQRIAIERKFGRYYSPDLVRRLADNPQELKIEGEMRVATALFSDIEGFTAMSERAAPRLLVGRARRLFRGRLRHRHPAWRLGQQDRRRRRACPLQRAARPRPAMPGRRSTAPSGSSASPRPSANARDASELGFGRTRIGFETGPVIVGDVGGLGHLDYTAHGDAVNSAARLEAINKVFGTAICLGPRAAAAIAEPGRLRHARPRSCCAAGPSDDRGSLALAAQTRRRERRAAWIEAYRAMEAGRDDGGAPLRGPRAGRGRRIPPPPIGARRLAAGSPV